MEANPMAENTLHHRRTIRLQGYDYTSPGAYFVTLVTHQREQVFGSVIEGQMRLNQFGEIVAGEWMKTAQIRPVVVLHPDEFVIMPNHLHGIIWIIETDGATRDGMESVRTEVVGATRRVAPTLVANSIGAIIGQIKTISTKQVNALRGTPGTPLWQRNFYEHIIRNEAEFEKIWNYIDSNPQQWQEDRENPLNQGTMIIKS
jgi:REP element-mobilizing transposase RayT